MEKRIKFNLEIPNDIKFIHRIFIDNGFKLFIVGGSVRDALLGVTPKDWDLATDAIPDKVEDMMKEAKLRTLATGKAFGVINVFTDTDEFEIATFRADSKESDGRRPDSVTFTTIEGDVERRDLTINALFFDLDTSEIVDLVGGVEDLKNGIIRTVGRPEDRFNEDRLRILRAIRFAARFNNGLHSSVIDALNVNSSLEGISSERIRDEFLKGLKTAKSTIFFLEMLDSFNLFDWIFPNMVVNKNFIEDKDPIIQLATLLKFEDWGGLTSKLNMLTFPSSDINSIQFLLMLEDLCVSTVVTLKKARLRTNLNAEQVLSFGECEGISLEMLNAFEKFDLTVNGDEVMKEFNLKPSKELGNKINELEIENFKKLLGVS